MIINIFENIHALECVLVSVFKRYTASSAAADRIELYQLQRLNYMVKVHIYE